MDDHRNFAFSLVTVAPVPADSGTELTIQAIGTIWPTPPFNATLAPDGVLPLLSNSEIVRVTGITGNVFTIVRAQEGTTAQEVAAGWRIANTITRKVLTDIEDALNALAPGSLYYVHNQGSASSTWNISHNLGAYPNVTVVDSAGSQVEGSVDYTDDNTIVISFSAPFGGKAFLT